MTRQPHLFEDALVRLDNLPAAGRDIAVEADESAREAIAERLGITAVERLVVRANATPFRGGIRVTGQLDAEIEQPCVVTFEPVTQVISEPIDRVLLPGSEQGYSGPAGAEIFIDLESDEIPDHFDGGEADLSELIVETLSLAIDPYPHAPDAVLPDAAIDLPGEDDKPFAALKALKKPE